MENKTKIPINIILITIIILIIVVAAAYKTNKIHKEKLFDAMESKIIEKGLKCYNEEKCLAKTITLQELYDNDYLDEIINPLNNEYLNPASYVEVIDYNEGKLTIIDE